MGAPSMEPVTLEFDRKQDAEDFVRWAESEEKDDSPEMQRIKSLIAEAREMRRRGSYRF